MNYTLIFAGGVGARMGSAVPKQFLYVAGKPIIIHTLEHFSQHPLIDGIIVVCKEEYISQCVALIKEFSIKKILDVIPGGGSGQESIFNGLAFLHSVSKEPSKDIVLVHDGVRPMIDNSLITNSLLSVEKYGNSIAVSSAIETVIRVNSQGTILETVDRSECRNAKAPQCFYLEDLWKAHSKARHNGDSFIDSASMMSAYGYTLHTVNTTPENIKITTPNDYYMLKGMLETTSLCEEE